MSDSVRLDRWLWAARFFKTRSLAAGAVDGGKVHVNGTRVKRAKTISIGDELSITKGVYEFTVIVEALSQKRGPASEAGTLYSETEASRRQREMLRDQMKSAPTPTFEGKGRPSKKERRLMEKMRQYNDD
jgi:ribosome-associated heat shock protein Hsp15